MTDIADFWSHDSFMDNVTAALIAAYESEIDNHYGNPFMSKRECGNGISSLNHDHLSRVRKKGIFIPAPDRILLTRGYIAAKGEPPPRVACIAVPYAASARAEHDNFIPSYCHINYCRQIDRLPAEIRRTANGVCYELVSIWPQNKGGVVGLRLFLVLKADGQARLQYPSWVTSLDPEADRSEFALTGILQWEDDKRHQWTITVQDEQTKVTVGSYAEAVKSVLYARSLPLTASGRKRPILHLVSAHRRRMASGIDIDISEFLRGTREVLMDGFRCVVFPSVDDLERLKKSA